MMSDWLTRLLIDPSDENTAMRWLDGLNTPGRYGVVFSRPDAVHTSSNVFVP